MDYYQNIPLLLMCAWLVPLASFAFLFVFGRRMCEAQPIVGGYIATTAIVLSAALSFVAMFAWVGEHFPTYDEHFGHHGHADAGHGGHGGHDEHKKGHGDKHEGEEEHGDKHEGEAGHDEKKHDEKKHDEGAKHEGESKEDGEGDDAAGEASDKAAACDDEPAELTNTQPNAEPKSTSVVAAYTADEAPADTEGDEEGKAAGDEEGHSKKETRPSIAGEYYTLGVFGNLKLSIGYYIDALTITMFCMVTLIASCIHFYAMGYMHDEESDVTDHEVTLSDGSHLHRPGRFYRFFQYLSLFCFSMLGIVLAGNIAMVFIFWELVGICSYFLIGFYVERQSASTAANKAFIVNRVGDFGMIIGLMALWTSLGTFTFGDVDGETGIFSQVRSPDNEYALQTPDGMVRLSAANVALEKARELGPNATQEQREQVIADNIDNWRTDEDGRPAYGYWLLTVAGIGIFCGCVGKSAQFPLHTWLPDAMEGPTPVSALVHSATMVAAGVYLVARFYPVFTPEVLLVVATSGCFTLFIGATIAITATDIKRVLAYSTISQLGYMMVALGVGGWIAGVMHLITHAFFKSLLFMCSGSVIHAVHTNEMTEMGGLRKKMPITAYTMLIGCLAIAGAGVPFLIGFSGYYSKDLILEQAYSFGLANGMGLSGVFFLFAAAGAAITTFYMFRLWFMTFAGQPRDQHRYDHAHESPPVMTYPLLILSVFAIAVAWGPAQALLAGGVALVVASVLLGRAFGWPPVVSYVAVVLATILVWLVFGWAILNTGAEEKLGVFEIISKYIAEIVVTALAGVVTAVLVDRSQWSSDAMQRYGFMIGAVGAGVLLITGAWGVRPLMLEGLLQQAYPEGALLGHEASYFSWMQWAWPSEPISHDYKVPITLLASATAAAGFTLALLMYGLGYLNPEDARRQFAPAHHFLRNKWWFDEIYDFVFVRPCLALSGFFSAIDRDLIDRVLNWLAGATVQFARGWELLSDRLVVDGFINGLANWVRSLGLSLRAFQTGNLRQYVMFIAIGAVVLFLLITFFLNPASLAQG